MAEGNFELPQQDQAEVLHEAEAREEMAQAEHQPAAVETVGKAQESSTGKQPPQLIPQDDQAQAPVLADDQAQAAAPVQPMSDDDKAVAALPAKDADLIEKEWVERAKSIISKTADDPHRQKSEVSKMKAAYIRKRFNKVIKTDEAAV
jgi:hypothetical protein